MRRLYTQLLTRYSLNLFSWSIFYALLLMTAQLRAQQSSLVCNTITPLVNVTAVSATTPGDFNDLTVTSQRATVVDLFTNKNALIDDNLNNSASYTFAGAGSAYIEVEDNDASTAATNYPAGSFAGFAVNDNTILAAFGTITITTYNSLSGTSAIETSNSNSLISTGIASGIARIGFITTKPFNRVRIQFSALGVGTANVYYAIVEKFCAGNPLVCNTRTPMVGATYPVSGTTNIGIPAAINATHTGVSGVSTFTIVNADNLTDSDLTNYASISSPVNISGPSSVSLAVKDQVKPAGYPAGTFAGFDVQNVDVIGVELLNSTTIRTYLGGVLKETVSGGSSSLISIPLLSAAGRQTIGFVTMQAFDEIQIVFSGAGGFSIGGTRIYSAVLKSFCNAPTLVCSTSVLTPLTNPTYPVYINNKNTGVGALGCAGCGINNAENVINGSIVTPATISLGAGVASSITFSVANALDEYPKETFAGFDIESSTLLSAGLGASTTITLYNNGTAVQSGTGMSLLAGVSLPSSGNRQIIGTVAQVPFDEIVIEFNQLGNANLELISIYRAVVQKSCVTPVVCNQTRYLKNNEFSAVIEGTRTGFSGAASVDLTSNSIQNPQNVVSDSKTDFARIINVADKVQASISVADPANVYPAGTFAGFTIAKGTFIVSADLLQNLTVTTYLNGKEQESKSGSTDLLNLTVFVQLFGTASNFYNVGFATTKPFDEIRLSVRSFASTLQIVDVYGAFVDTRFSSDGGTLVCNFVLNPDFNVTTKNIPVLGDVSTNDKVPSGTTYGTPAPTGGNPSGATIILNSTGSYSFTATTPGTYTYTVPVCASGQTTCSATPLIITVLDATVMTNKPVANPDYASVQSSTATAGSVTVNVRANDGPGNVGGTLGTPTIPTAPTHGTATINGNGNVIYTPATGYVGDDILTYQVCENPGGLCATAQVTIHVVAPGSSTVSVDDDYVKTGPNMSVSGNVLTNDMGSGLTVLNPNTTVTSSGTLVISSTGSYTFTPASGVTGPVDFTYTACDNSSMAVCGNATLHVLIIPVPDLFPIIYFRPSTVYNSTDITVVVDVVELNSIATNGLITVKITKDTRVSLSFSTTATSVNDRMVQNSAWSFNDSDPSYYILTTSQEVAAGDKLSFGFTGTLAPGATTGTLTTSAVLTGNSGGEAKINNNADADNIDYFQQ